MSAPRGGRQSPSPSRQGGRQQADIPSWSGKAEEPAHGTSSIDNPSDTRDDDAGVKGLASNPVHPLAQTSQMKHRRLSEDFKGLGSSGY
ncbi:hypothetical protein FQN49_006775 [Arthroderma sp. PD_2]|nr:hypothetical protein FQN49_006775 [Arthroderma sp. PD_2]